MADRSVKVTLSADVSRYKTAMDSAASSTSKVTSSTSALSKQIKQTFTYGAIYAGIAAVGAALKGVLTLGVSFDEQMNTLGAVTQASAGQMQSASKEAMALGNAIDIPRTSAADAADAMVDLAKGGLTMQQSMEAARGTLILAAAAQVSGAQAATIQANALNQFELSATSAGHVADVLANVANAASGEITDIAAALTYTGGIAHSFGISIDSTATALGIFAKNGMTGTLAGTTLRSMLVHLAAPSAQATDAMNELGLTVYDSQGKFVGLESLTQQLAAAQERLSPAAFQAASSILFGQRAVQGAILLANAGAQGYDDMADAVSRVGGASDLANAKMKGLPGSLQKAENSAQNLALTVYQRLEPSIQSVVDGFTKAADVAGPVLATTLGTVADAATAVAHVFGMIPAPIRDIALALAGLALANKIGLISKLGSAFDTVRIRAMYAADAIKGISFASVTAGAKSAGTSVVSAFGGPWSLAITGAVTGVGLLIKAWNDAKPVVRDFTSAVDDNTGALSKNAAAAVASVAQDDLVKWDKLGGDVATYTKALLGNKSAQADMKQQMVEIAYSLVQQSAAWDHYSGRFLAAGYDIVDVSGALVDSVLGNGKAFNEMADKAGIGAAGISTLENAIGPLSAATAQYQANTVALSDDLNKARVSHLAVAGATKQTTKATNDSADAATNAFLAYNNARVALQGYGNAAAVAATDITDATSAMVNQASAVLNSALQLRQAISGSLTGFVSPTGAWDTAVQQAQQAAQAIGNSGGGSGKNPAVTAAAAAVKAQRARVKSTTDSAKAERDAAVKYADQTRDAIVDRAKADAKSAKDAETNAKKRVDAAKKEADSLKQIADDQVKAAQDAEAKLSDAEFAKRAADAAVAAARAGLAGASTPLEQASWQRALNSALDDQATATRNLTSAQSDYQTKTDKATASKTASKQASVDETAAEKDYATAQTAAAKATEDSQARQKAANDAYTKAKEQADTRYNKSVDAVNATLQKLIDKQDAAQQSAQTMSSGTTSALSDMSSKAQPSLSQYLRTLKDQVADQQAWHDNIVALAAKLPPDVALQLAQLGPQSAPMVAELVNGTDAQLDEFADLFPKSTDKGVQGMVNSIVRAVVPAGANAAKLSDAMIEQFLTEFSNAKTEGQAQQALADLEAALQNTANQNPLLIPLSLDQTAALNQMASFYAQYTSPNASAVYNPLKPPGSYASGGDVADGWFWSGENGPELGYKQGSNVHMYDAASSAQMSTGPTIQQINHIYYPQGVPPAMATNRQLADAAALVSHG